MDFWPVSKLRRSGEDFEEKLTEFFAASREFRTSLRKGDAVVIVDPSAETFEALRFVVEKCGMPVRIFHFETAEPALDFIDDVGSNAVKCVVVDQSVAMSGSINFLRKMQRQNPRVPVFVKGCSDIQVRMLHSRSYRVGVVTDPRPTELCRMLGLPQPYGCEVIPRVTAG